MPPTPRKCDQGTCPNPAVWVFGRLDENQVLVMYYLCHNHAFVENDRFLTMVEAVYSLLSGDEHPGGGAHTEGQG